MSILKFHPGTGFSADLGDKSFTADEFRAKYPATIWYFNPWTGEARSASAITFDHACMLEERSAIDGEQLNVRPTPTDTEMLDMEPGSIVMLGDAPEKIIERSYLAGYIDPRKEATPSAPEILDTAAKHMRDRAATYDKPEGERSMAQTVAAFNAITGRDLIESEGWLLMSILKMVRSETRSDPHRDSIEDFTAYSALYGEARLKGL